MLEGEALLGGMVGGGHGVFKADHGALHALVGGVGEEWDVEGDGVDFGAAEEAGDLGGVVAGGFECAAEAGVDGEAGGESECGWGGDVGLGEEVHEGGVLFVDADEGAFDLGESLIEDAFEDAVLLVGEERGEGVEGVAEVGVDETEEGGEIGAADESCGVVAEGGPGFGGGPWDWVAGPGPRVRTRGTRF